MNKLQTTLFFLTSLLIVTFIYPLHVFAQSVTSCVITKVGEPQTSPPILPPECKTSANITCNEPVPTSNIAQAIEQKFKITMRGFDDEHLAWAWEKFCEVGNINFLNYVNGAKIMSISENISQQVGCPGEMARVRPEVFGDNNVVLFPYTPKEFFKFIIIHELGHVIHNCEDRATIRWNDTIQAAQQEGAVSYYGANAQACTGSDNNSENYADAVAYYLTRDAGLSTARCGGAAPPTPPNPFWGSPVLKPLHFDIMKSIFN